MKFTTSINSLLLLASAASACIYKRAEGEAEWGYTGLKGPLLWHTLDSANSKCAAGTNQSPINVAPATLQQAAVKLQYPSAGDFEVHNNGHTVELTPLEYGSTPDYSQSKYSVLLDGNTFKLAQFHFHTPSEHRLNDVSYPLEVHFVHTCPETKEFAVVGIFFDVVEGAGEDFTHKLAPPVGRHTGGGIRNVREKDQTAELKDIPFARIQKHLADHPASHYSGSLTTPPCTEDIKWYVSQTPMQIDVGEYQAFKEILKFNARYTQNSPGEPNLLAASCTAEDSTIDIMDMSDSDSDVEDEEH